MFTNPGVLEITSGASEADALHLAPVDLKHLRRFTLGDMSLEKEVLELFLGQLPQTITALNGAATEQDWKVAAHTLKGSGRAVGAWRIARLAELAEGLSSGRCGSGRSDAVARIEEAAREARSFIVSRYGLDATEATG